MKLQDQVCTLQQAKRLKELGVKQDSLYYYTEPVPGVPDWWIACQVLNLTEQYSGFTVAELGQMLPARIFYENDDWFLTTHKGKRGWYIQYQTNKLDAVVNAEGELDRPKLTLFKTWRDSFNMAEAFADYLILLLENKLIEIESLNN
jgi:hypothetical protein